ncbi:MAG: hypothetical protein Tsb0020_13550 [Haliangiales bacterium]
MHRKNTLAAGLISLLFAMVALPSLASAGWYQVIEFEIAEDATRFAFDDQHVFAENGFPAYGNAFITQGYIYPKGTLAADANGAFNGVNPDGSPEFTPIGEWTCRGWFIGDGFGTVSGPVVMTTQTYDLNLSEPGRTTIVSDGMELIDIGQTVRRAITGGTGQHSEADGQVKQTLLGFNPLGGVALSLRLEVE